MPLVIMHVQFFVCAAGQGALPLRQSTRMVNAARRTLRCRQLAAGKALFMRPLFFTYGVPIIMPKKSYAQYMCQKHPELREMAKYYESLGFPEPVLWAESELKGEPAVAQAAFIYALRSEICEPDDSKFFERIQQGQANVENQALLASAAKVLEHIANAGLELKAITPLTRLIQTEVVRNIATVLEEGPSIACIPLPEDRPTHWQLFCVDEDEQPTDPILGVACFFNAH